MCRLGGLAGAGPAATQTPQEYVGELARRFPSVEQDVALLGRQYSRARYGRKELADDEREQLLRAWRRARRQLLFRVFVRTRPAAAAPPDGRFRRSGHAREVTMYSYDLLPTELGWVGALGSAKGLRQLTLPVPSPDAAWEALDLSSDAPCTKAPGRT